MNNKLSINNIKKIFQTKEGELCAIDDVSFDLRDGEILAIVGTSGCGKSTLLNIIAGLDSPTEGTLLAENDNPKISYMLQSDALLPWRNVLSNACLGLELERKLDSESKLRVEEMLKDYGLGDFLSQYPSGLSGGMKQRVALIRSLAIEPDILLLDEPFSALDYYTRVTISEDVHDMIKKSGTSAIIITHDIHEALSIGDRVIVLSSRPSKVKNIYEVDFKDVPSVLEKRGLPRFNELYKSIWGDLDEEI
ncbi:MAG TPA: spermidine/putrescine ABC transporter ATP-binding protein [Firmicutes bacterium]|nr:spermidine/putrescine ABC transporter ATP-binding protein [Bacillota bacterium]